MALKSQACSAVNGGFLIWAAKPSVRESPNPAIISLQRWPASPLRWPLLTLTVTHSLPSKFHSIVIVPFFLGCTLLDVGRKLPIAVSSRIHDEFTTNSYCATGCRWGHSRRLFCESAFMWRGHSCPRKPPENRSRYIVEVYCRIATLSFSPSRRSATCDLARS